jgi:DNA-directed RNA polymerase specialized sigma subunit
MLPEVIKSKEKGVITDALASMLMMLTKKYAQRPCFAGYSFKEDMISEALANLCQNALKFNPEKSSNPFAYYTTCINSSFLQFLNVEKKHRRIRDQLLVDIGENPSFSFLDETKQSHEFNSEINELKTQIEEAKVRMTADALVAAAKAAQEGLLDDETEEIVESLEEDFIPNVSLLDFGELNENKD